MLRINILSENSLKLLYKATQLNEAVIRPIFLIIFLLDFFIFVPHSWGPLQLIYTFQRNCAPFVHILVPKNGLKKGKNFKKRQKNDQTKFQKCVPDSVFEVEQTKNNFENLIS